MGELELEEGRRTWTERERAGKREQLRGCWTERRSAPRAWAGRPDSARSTEWAGAVGGSFRERADKHFPALMKDMNPQDQA